MKLDSPTMISICFKPLLHYRVDYEFPMHDHIKRFTEIQKT